MTKPETRIEIAMERTGCKLNFRQLKRGKEANRVGL